MSKKLDMHTLRRLVEHKYSLIQALKEYDSTNLYGYRQPTFCPFHHNDDTPAATIYKGNKGNPDVLFCFAEQKRYTVADVVSKLMGYNIYEVGYAIWNDMTELEQDEFLTMIGKVDYEKVFGSNTNQQDSNELSKNKVLFKEGRIKLKDLLKSLVDNL